MRRGWILLISIFVFLGFFSGAPVCWFLGLTENILGFSGTITGFIVAPIILFFLIYFWWAPNNLYFTFVPEGRAKTVVKGDAFEKHLIQWKGRTFDDKWNVVFDGHILKDGSAVFQEKWHPFGGFRYYGFWPFVDIYVYSFEWTGIKPNGEPDSKKEIIDHIILKDDVYWAKIEKAEDKELLPLDIVVLLTIRVANPYKAQFVAQNWLEIIVNRTSPLVRDYVTNETYEALTISKEEIGKAVWAASKKLRREFRIRYGIELRKIEVKDIDPPENYRELTLKRFMAEKERQAVVIQAEGEAERIQKVNEAIKGFGDLGKLRTILDTAERSKDKWIIPLGLGELFSQVFPGKKPESISPDDIKALREILVKINEKI